MDFLIDFVMGFLRERNEDDVFDRLNYQITPFLFVLFSLVNISKLYIGTAINCFTKAEFRGGWIQYAEDYCLVENTYYLRTNESIPLEAELRGQKYISYYQWVPFILVLQACSFYVPHLMWRSFNWTTGYQIRTVVTTAKESADAGALENHDKVLKIARSLYHANRLNHRALHIVPSQRFVTLLYLTMKLAYILLILVHLTLFRLFLGNVNFAFDVLSYRGEWQDSGIFPRVTVCDFGVYRLGQIQHYTLECVLPLNMFNEKIFVFFFFWLCLLLGTTTFSLTLWIRRIFNRDDFFRKLLNIYWKNERSLPQGSPNSYISADDTSKLIVARSFRSSKFEPVSSNRLNFAAEFGPDLRVALGLVQDQTGLIFCSNVFREICQLSENQRSSQGSPIRVENNKSYYVDSQPKIF